MSERTLGPLAAGKPSAPLPGRWQWVPLEDVARLESGHTPSRRRPEYWDGAIPWLGIRDARAHHGREIFETVQTISKAGLANSAARLLPCGTVCLSRTASVGYVCVLGTPMATSQDFVNWVCSDAIDPQYLKFVLIAAGREGLAGLGEGTVHTTIYMPMVRTFHVALPPTNEQARIVARLTTIFDRAARARELLEDVPSLAEAVRRTFLSAACAGALTASWRARAGGAPDRDVPPPLGRVLEERRRRWVTEHPGKEYAEPMSLGTNPALPPTWSYASLVQLTDALRPVRYGILMPGPEVPEGIPYVKVRDMGGERIDRASLSRTSPEINERYSRSSLATGDLLVSIRGSYGRVVAVDRELDGVNITQDSARVAALPGVDPEYLRFALLAPATQRFFERVATGIAVRGINVADLRTTPVPLPPEVEQREIVRRLRAALSLVASAVDRCATFASELDGIQEGALRDAFRGALAERDAADPPVDLVAARAQVTDGRNQAKETRVRGPKSTMTTISRAAMLDAMNGLPKSEFTFDELRRAVPGDYELFRDTLFQLLSEPGAPVAQTFDPKLREIRLRRVAE